MQITVAGSLQARSCFPVDFIKCISLIFIGLCCGPGHWGRPPVAESSAIARTEWISRLRANANANATNTSGSASTGAGVAAAIGSSVEISADDNDNEANNRTVRRAQVNAWPLGGGQYRSVGAEAAGQQRRLQPADSTPTNDLKLFTLTNTCERDFMLISIRASRPFYGVIHTKNERHKSICSLEGNGEFEFHLNISHALDTTDPNHCGVFKATNRGPMAAAASADGDQILSVILAIRMHRNIELSSDKFYLLNCTNRCRRPDCSSPTTGSPDKGFGRLINSEEYNDELEGQDRPGGRRTANGVCSIESFPWLVILVSLLSLLLLVSVVSHCLLCSSLIRHKHKLTDQERRKAQAERHERALEEVQAGMDYDGWVDVGRSARRKRMEKNNSSKQKRYINYDNRNLYRTKNKN